MVCLKQVFLGVSQSLQQKVWKIIIEMENHGNDEKLPDITLKGSTNSMLSGITKVCTRKVEFTVFYQNLKK